MVAINTHNQQALPPRSSQKERSLKLLVVLCCCSGERGCAVESLDPVGPGLACAVALDERGVAGDREDLAAVEVAVVAEVDDQGSVVAGVVDELDGLLEGTDRQGDGTADDVAHALTVVGQQGVAAGGRVDQVLDAAGEHVDPTQAGRLDALHVLELVDIVTCHIALLEGRWSYPLHIDTGSYVNHECFFSGFSTENGVKGALYRERFSIHSQCLTLKLCAFSQNNKERISKL